jgi:hypothetical protein
VSGSYVNDFGEYSLKIIRLFISAEAAAALFAGFH